MKSLFLLSCALAALCPLFASRLLEPSPAGESTAISGASFLPSYGEDWDTATLLEEMPYRNGFPGKLRAGRSARGHYLIREIAAPTRALHSSYDCFQGSGYRVDTPKVEHDPTGQAWSVFTAQRGAEKLRVYEVFVSATGETWTDVSSWYWNALFKRTQGPWQAITRVEAEPS